MTQTTTYTPRHTDAEVRQIAQTMIEQIGRMNILAISGGKKTIEYDGQDVEIVLPCGYGYQVRICYETGRDLYRVSRCYQKGLNFWIKGEKVGVYDTELGEEAYRAGMFRDDWTTQGARKVI